MEEDGRPTLTGDPTDRPVEPLAWQVDEPAPLVAGEHLAATIAALADPATRSPRPDTCPFLRTIDASGAAAAPVEIPDPANCCVAVGSPTPQSARQQQLVCLTSGHSNCPLYLRGTLIAGDAIAAAPPRRGPSAAIVGSILVLIAAAAMSVGFLLVRGGFDLPAVAVVPSLLADGEWGSLLAERRSDRDADRHVPGGVGRRIAVRRTAHDCANAIPFARARDTVAAADPRPNAGPDAGDRGHRRPLRPARQVPGNAELLDLHRSLRRQLPEHRELVRGSV